MCQHGDSMISVIIIAKNEEKTIQTCLESVRWADEIIVLDSGSDDKTMAIASQYTANVYATDWQGYGVQKDRALAYASGDWVLNLDADESVDEALRKAILVAIQSHSADAYRIPIQMIFYGKAMRYSYSPSRHVRLFKREGAQFSHDMVHEKIQLPHGARIGQLTTPITHCSFRDVSHVLYKINKYSSYTANMRLAEGRKASLIKTCLGAVWMFFRCYIVQRGFLDGREGFLLALFNAQGTFYRGIKQLYPDEFRPEGVA